MSVSVNIQNIRSSKLLQENKEAAAKLQEDLVLESDKNIRSLEKEVELLNEQLTNVR